MQVYLDIARHIGTPLPRNTKANGRQMVETMIAVTQIDEYEYMPVYADSGDYTFAPRTHTDAVVTIDGDTGTLTCDALARLVYRLQDELAAVEAQVVELRERINEWEANS